MKKILFLCNQIPNNLDGGGIVYSDIIKCYGEEKFSYISLIHPLKSKDLNIESENVINQYSFTISRKNIFFKILSKLPFFQTVYVFFNILRFKKEIFRFIINNNFDAIFAPLRGEVLLILPYIIKKTRLPLYAMIEDTVEAEIADPFIIYNKKKKSYYEILSSVKSLAVAGETMKNYFKSNFNINSEILRLSFNNFSNVKNKNINNTFNVFFSGSLYAKKELLIFIKALEIFSEKSNLKVSFYIASHAYFSNNSRKLNIINLGWVSEGKLKEYMNICHIAYLPYQFERKFKHRMQYAFPGKSGFYISNNLPVFFHGPKYSSFNFFLSEYPLGLCCDSLDPKIICAKLFSVVDNKLRYSDFQNFCFNAFKDKFNKKVFSKNVSNFFEINN